MATKVYLSGRNIIVAKDGETSVSIIQHLAKYSTIQQSLSIDGVTVPEVESIQFKDVKYLTTVSDTWQNITDQSGNTFATFYDLQQYLNGFIFTADSIVLTKEGATSENQELIIAQNDTIISQNTTIEENTYELGKIKEIEADSNKLLKKIYNHE